MFSWFGALTLSLKSIQYQHILRFEGVDTLECLLFCCRCVAVVVNIVLIRFVLNSVFFYFSRSYSKGKKIKQQQQLQQIELNDVDKCDKKHLVCSVAY